MYSFSHKTVQLFVRLEPYFSAPNEQANSEQLNSFFQVKCQNANVQRCLLKKITFKEL